MSFKINLKTQSPTSLIEEARAARAESTTRSFSEIVQDNSQAKAIAAERAKCLKFRMSSDSDPSLLDGIREKMRFDYMATPVKGKDA